MRAKRVVAVAVLLVIAFLIVFPPLANGSVKIALSSSSSVPVEHLYVTIRGIKAHRADTHEPAGWFSVANTSTQVDLALVNSSEAVALGFLSLGQYDTISLEVTDATAVVNGISKPVQLTSRVFPVPASFLVRFGAQTAILLKVVPELQVTPDIMNLKLSFTAVPVEAVS
jgi:hypothetical protein